MGDDRATTTSIAVPVMAEAYVIGAICVAFMSSAEPLKKAVAKFVPALNAAAEEIVRARIHVDI
jgi:DNA-binding IclR family transcriptional regulator